MSLQMYSSHRSIEIRSADSWVKSFPVSEESIPHGCSPAWQILDGGIRRCARYRPGEQAAVDEVCCNTRVSQTSSCCN